MGATFDKESILVAQCFDKLQLGLVDVMAESKLAVVVEATCVNATRFVVNKERMVGTSAECLAAKGLTIQLDHLRRQVVLVDKRDFVFSSSVADFARNWAPQVAHFTQTPRVYMAVSTTSEVETTSRFDVDDVGQGWKQIWCQLQGN